MSKEKILVIDDEAEIRDIIENYLLREDMIVTKAECGESALALIKRNQYDLIILDIMMSGIDGYEVLRRIRSANEHLHVIILSARDEDDNKVLGLGLGADDYVTKPFSRSEFVARVKSQLRRVSIVKNANPQVLEIISRGVFDIDTTQYLIFKNKVKLDMSVKEFKLFKFLAENEERVFTKRHIYENIWDDNYFDDNTLMVYIRHLREKIEDDPNNPKYIITIRGIGYKFTIKETKNEVKT